MISKPAFFILFATFMFSLMNVAVKWLDSIPALQIVFFRSLISLAISGFLIKRKKISFWGHNKKILILRGIAGSIGLALIFTAMHRLPLASAVTLTYLNPIFTALLAIPLLNEKLRRKEIFLLIFAFVGVILIRFDPRVNWPGLLAGVGGAFFAGLAYNFVRMSRETEDPLVVILYFPLVAVPLTLPFVIMQWENPDLMEWLALLAIGISTQIAQFYLTKAYQGGKASEVANLTYSGIFFAVIWGYLFFDEGLTLASFLGILMILASVVYQVIVMRKKKE